MRELVLGPMLRYVGEREAAIWVETDAACEVEILGTRERTFCVCGHHYALVCIGDLEEGAWHEYEVLLDGDRVWPEADSPFPPSAFRTFPMDGPLQVIFGSCRLAAPHAPPFSLTKDDHDRGREVDALHTLALHMSRDEREDWPDVLLMIGDQVYADEVSPATAAFIETRRDPTEPPGDRVLDFEEYTRLYRESWTEPAIRWLFSTVSTSMIFDDHDVHDDWNISAAWLEEMQATDWWEEHIVGALMSYWVYQHLGNLSPAAHRRGRAAAADQGGRRRRGDPARPRREVGPRHHRHALELLPRPGAHARDRDRLARRAGARGGPPHDGRRRGMGLDREAQPTATSTTC